MAENDDVIDEGAPEVPVEETPELETEPKSFTQEQINEVIAARLRDEAEKQSRREAQYQREIAERDAFIQGLRTATPKQQMEDPYADLSDEEKSLIRVSERAQKKTEKRLEDFMQQVAGVLAPIAAKEAAVEFFETKGKVPAEVQKKTMQYLRQLGSQGVNMQGAYRLAMADYAEDVVNGRVAPAAAPAPAAKKPAAPVPHTELGGSRRSLANPPAAKEDEKLSWSEFRQKAEAARKFAPMEGAVYGPNGAQAYRPFEEE